MPPVHRKRSYFFGMSKQKTFIINERGEWESESDPEGGNDGVEEEQGWEVGGTILSHEELDGEALVVCCSLNAQVMEEEKGQRHNLFHTRCLINSKICRVIVDSGSCNNIASKRWSRSFNCKQNVTHTHTACNRRMIVAQLR